MISYYGFDLCFPDVYRCKHSSIYLLAICIICILWNNVYSIPFPVLKNWLWVFCLFVWVLGFFAIDLQEFLNILGICPLSSAWYANVSFCRLQADFRFVAISFAEQKHFSLTYQKFFILCLFSYCIKVSPYRFRDLHINCHFRYKSGLMGRLTKLNMFRIPVDLFYSKGIRQVIQHANQRYFQQKVLQYPRHGFHGFVFYAPCSVTGDEGIAGCTTLVL